MNKNMSDKKFSEILKNKDKLKDKSPEEILDSLSPSDAKKVKDVINNPELAKKLLNSPKAQELMKKLMGGSDGK